MLATGFAIVLSSLLRLRWSLGVFFVLDKLDVRNLRLWRRWYQKEESQDETGKQNSDVKQVRARSSLGHF